MRFFLSLLLLLGFVLPPRPAEAQAGVSLRMDHVIVLDDFESYADGALPVRWKYLHDRKLMPLEPRFMRPKERFYVVDEGQNKVLRVYTEGEAVHLTMANEPEGFDWDLRTHPRLRWRWRALRLPEGAHEDDERFNDTGVALYVYFRITGVAFLRRPEGIKYTYSSTLPVGTVVDYGKLKVLVVSSGADGIGAWHTIERDVVADYRRLFGTDPPDRPLSIRLWSDSDNTGTVGEADFDDIVLLPAR
ncbi:DUF3047 domain-containing protein [Rhodocaloribacter litoris]|uniref:DUF3047 domain-containing protein n=1 Tax=Rhodocaloribacter litoris TaxID=2558931 RepID=UPI00141D9B8B|nr:DUF3047 domain-containing protein [Rhodocaloribacter litoris]QXD13712.1 DUF3047 domain-containing protein [Rhodocaloribacter litoris]